MTTAVPEGGVVIDYPPRRDGSRGPHPRQAEAHATEAEEVLFGGAAGPGKTDWLIAETLAVLHEFPGANGVIFRRTYPQLAELGGIAYRLLDRLPQPAVGRYNAQEHIWHLANGSRLRLAHCQRDADVTKYQGAEWAVAAFDQLEQFTEFQYTYLLHRLRVSGELAVAMEAAGYRPKSIASANPGGVGHGWVKRRFIDPFPKGGVIFRPAPSPEEPDPLTRAFIPATHRDNPDLDVNYVRRLQNLPNDDLRRAMVEGDWSVHAGQRFRAFRVNTHVIDPEQLPLPIGAGLPRGMGIDYGRDAPFCALWGAKLHDNLVVVYRELYKADLTATQQAELILRSEAPGERRPGRPVPAALDPSTWTRSPHVATPTHARPDTRTNPNYAPPGSIAAAYNAAGVPVIKAINDRLQGAALVDEMLRVRPGTWAEGGGPRLLIYSTCRNLIRTLPDLQRDDKNPEDVDTDGEDHAYDALRYLLNLLVRLPPSAMGAPGPPAPSPSSAKVGETITGGLRRQGF